MRCAARASDMAVLGMALFVDIYGSVSRSTLSQMTEHFLILSIIHEFASLSC